MPILGSLGAATAKGVGFTAVPAELPGIPTIGTATVTGGTSVSVSYTAPTFDGNTSILSYTAAAYNYPSGTATGITGTAYGPNSGSVTVTGLTSGSAYTFKVYATNGIGNSGLSGASNNITTWVVPGAPTIGAVTYTNGNSFAAIAYTQPASNGGTAIVSYTAVAYVSGVESGQTGLISQATSGSITVTGLVGGQTYTFKVYATNAVGNSALSTATSPARAVLTKPYAPTVGTATYTTGTSATVAYTAPSNNGGAAISSYTVKAYIAGVATAVTGTGTTSPLSITGLTKGTAYTFRVAATNTYGLGEYSTDSNSITPLTVPAAPTIGDVLATSGTSADVYFIAPTDTGGNSTYVTSYTVTSTPGSISVTKNTDLPAPGDPTFVSFTGLTKGQAYTFTAYATNPIGNSTNSSASTPVTPADVPNAPTINLVTTSTTNTGPGGTAIVNYSAPADNGGATITSYTAVSSPGFITATVNTAASGTITFTTLAKGTAYTFTVYATNRIGNSTDSNTSSSITPLTFPAAPTIGTATATGANSATVAYTAPVDAGGSSIINYIATSSPSATLSQLVTSPGVITISNGLTKGQSYTFTVAAVNSTGTGANSGSSGSITTWTEPGAPTIGTATEVNATTVTVSFTAGTTGGTPILDFTATAYVGGVATAVTSTGATSPITVTGLTQGTTYTFKVTARNVVGTGLPSGASNTAQPADAPSKPTAPTVTTSTTYTTDGRVTITFTAPYDGGTTITDYYFVSSPVTSTKTVTQAGGGTYIFTGLTKGTAYTFSYAAKNRIGTGVYSDASSSITPLTVPKTPVIGTASRFDATSVNVGFTESTDNGGTAITGYTATSTPGGITGTSLTTPILVTGLTKGTSYTFTVHATNSRGDSGESTSSNSATPATVPNAPTIGTATTVSKNSISVSFTAPADNGGNTITSYTAVSTPGGISQTISQAGSGSITVTGLSPATSYTFIVYASNAYGNSVNSSSSNNATTSNSYVATPSPTTINESSSKTVTYTIDTIGVANGTTLYWTNSGTTSSADFIDNVNSGSFTISANAAVPPVGTASITRTTVADLFTEGTETIVLSIRTSSVSGTIVGTATSVNVNDTSLTPTPTYSITEDTTSLNETTNRTVNFSISTQYVPNGTTLYWQLYTGVQAADFTAGTSTGSVTISGASGTPATGGTASFSLTTTTDHLTEGGESFFIYLGTNSPASSFNVATSGVISISDTSLTYGTVTVSPTTYTANIPKTGLALTLTGNYVTTMATGTPGTITNQPITYIAVYSSVSVTPTSRTFTALNQTQTATWTLVTNAVDYANTSYTATFGSVLDTADSTIPNNYPTHAITLNRVQYTEDITVSPTSGYTNTTFTYTVKGAPGTTIRSWNSVNGYAAYTTATLSGSQGDASFGTYSSSGNFWITPGTYTVYIYWAATAHGDSSQGFSAGWAAHTSVSVTVTYPPITFTYSPTSSMTGQVGSPFTGDQLVYSGTASVTAAGGAGGPYSYAVTSGALPAGVSLSSSGTYSGTPTTSQIASWGITATGASSVTGTGSSSAVIVVAPTIDSYSVSPSTVTVNNNATLSWTSTGTNSVALVVNGVSQGNKTSNGSFTLNFSTAGSYSGTLTPRAKNFSSLGTVQNFSWTVVGAPTVTVSQSVSSAWWDGSVTYSWSSTNATSLESFVNGSSGGALAIPSGSVTSGPWPSGSDLTYNVYGKATNAAGTVVNSATVTLRVYTGPTLTASYTTTAITGGYRVTVTWSTGTATSTSSTLTGWSNGTSGTYNSDPNYGALPANNYGSFSITATRTIAGIGSKTVTKSVNIVVPGSGTFA